MNISSRLWRGSSAKGKAGPPAEQKRGVADSAPAVSNAAQPMPSKKDSSGKAKKHRRGKSGDASGTNPKVLDDSAPTTTLVSEPCLSPSKPASGDKWRPREGEAEIVFLSAFPGMSHLSAEELRFEAYKSEVADGGQPSTQLPALSRTQPPETGAVCEDEWAPPHSKKQTQSRLNSAPAEGLKVSRPQRPAAPATPPTLEKAGRRYADHTRSASLSSVDEVDAMETVALRPRCSVELHETEDTIAYWIGQQLTSSNDFTRVLKEALRKQTRHMGVERDMAVELRQAAEKETVRARMKAELCEAKLLSVQEESDAEMSALGQQLEAALSERDEALYELENIQNVQSGEELELREELSRALDQVVSLKQECKSLKGQVVQLEHKLQKSSDREAELVDELCQMKEQAKQGANLKKQLAASLLSALDMTCPDDDPGNTLLEAAQKQTKGGNTHRSRIPRIQSAES
mmetsp:Transcript_15705/g.43934  ORF Transcript_15705/g.43934 Transcript_15705/m.43934 type:complete len:461 (-) Transcript_15705:116-1498(-)